MSGAGIRYGASVHRFFSDDLRQVADRGLCLLPEWICESMVEAVHQAGWIVDFYPVMPPDLARVPLEVSEGEVRRRVARASRPCVVLLAHPLGYIDPSISALIAHDWPGQCPVLLLDSSQSYGLFPIWPSSERVMATYVSFNGNKLIDMGGALRMTAPMPENASPCFAAEARRKFDVLRHHLHVLGVSSLAEPLGCAAYHVSPMRTVLSWPQTQALHRKRLLSGGMVQPFLAQPRQCGHRMSPAYDAWARDFMLMFHQPRPEWKTHD